MTILDYALNTESVRTLLDEQLDLSLLDHPAAPQDKEGRITWSQPCQQFAMDSEGGQYLLLQDHTVAYFSCDGQAGRIADNLEEFFLMIINFGHWRDFCMDTEAEELIRQHPVTPVQEELSELLDVPLFTDRQILIRRFRDTVQRPEEFTAFYHHEEGTVTRSPSLLIEDVKRKEVPASHHTMTEQDRKELISRYGLVR